MELQNGFQLLLIAASIVALTNFSKAAASQARVKRSDCLVTADYNPVCGTDGQTYTNLATLKCDQQNYPDLSVAYQGKCGETETQSDDLDAIGDDSSVVARRQTLANDVKENENVGGEDYGSESNAEPQQSAGDDYVN